MAVDGINKWKVRGIPRVSIRFSLNVEDEQGGAGRDGGTCLARRLRRERGQGKNHFPCSADLDQDWQPYYPVDPYSAISTDHVWSHI